jgi:hypothetical protein
MTIRILGTAVGIVLMLASPGWAQSSTRSTASATGTTTFDSLSPGNQQIANALFSAQNTAGTTRTPLTKDQIAGLKGTEGWGKVFKEMKADGLVQAKNLGQVVSANQHQLNASRRGATSATGAARGRTATLASARMRGSAGGAGMTNGRGFAGGSRAMGGGVAVSSMGGGGFGHAGMGGMGGMGGGGVGHAGMGGGMGGGGFGGGGGGGRGR